MSKCNGTVQISVDAGDILRFKGTNDSYNSKYLTSDCRMNVKGNIMSLTNGDDFESANSILNNAFRSLFYNNTLLVSARYLKLPMMSLSAYCYSHMFSNCSSLIDAPELPALILDDYCYAAMFEGCTSLTTAPVLPALQLEPYCCSMLFNGCTLLNYIKAMFTTTPDETYTYR